MDSLELTRHLYKNNVITKEAAIRLLKKRKGLFKEAIESHVETLFKEAAVARGPTLLRKSLANMLPIAALAGVAAAGSTAAKFIANSAADAKLNQDVKTSFGQVFKEYPELQDNKADAAKHFQVIARFAPALAANPIVAGTWIKSTMNMGHIGPENVRMLIDAQRSWEDIRERRSPITGLTEALPPTHKIIEHSILKDTSE